MPYNHKSNDATHRLNGFTMVELAVVVTIIGILAALAIPTFKLATEKSQVSRIENDFRIYIQAFDSYELEFGSFPPSQPVGGLYPIGMEKRLDQSWKSKSPIGGEYRWIYDPVTGIAYIEVVNTASYPILISPSRLLEIDKELDDGNFNTGDIVIFGVNVRYYLRNPSP
ncbi:MAG: type II secretion system protein [Opitutaceae bacterium]